MNIFWDISTNVSCKNISEVSIVTIISVHRLLFTISVVPSSLDLVNLMMEEIRSSETSVLNKSHTA
jgi:hypothetical protein